MSSPPPAPPGARPLARLPPPALPRRSKLARSASSSSIVPESAAQAAPLLRLLRSRSLLGSSRAVCNWGELESIRSLDVKSRLVDFGFGMEARSTISAAFSQVGADLLASTHGDHSIKIVDVERGCVIQTLLGHPRTPWAVAFHPSYEGVLASGCLAGNVIVWDLKTGRNQSVSLTDHIMSVAFHPSEKILLIACGSVLYAWAYAQAFSEPKLLIESANGRIRSVMFTPDGKLFTAEPVSEDYFQPEMQEFMQVIFWSELSCAVLKQVLSGDLVPFQENQLQAASAAGLLRPARLQRFWPSAVAQRVIMYNEGGHGISSCGRFMAYVACPLEPIVCQKVESGPNRHPEAGQRVLVVISLDGPHLGRIVQAVDLPNEFGIGITCVKFSPTDRFIVLGYGVRNRPVVEGAEKRILTVFSFDPVLGFRLVKSMSAAGVDVNIALFNTHQGGGIVLGTRNGNLKVLG